MKLIVAIIKPFKIEEVKEALAVAKVEGMTVTEVRGFGGQRDRPPHDNPAFPFNFLPKVGLQIVVADEHVAAAVEAIEKTARTGKAGDGKILIVPLDDVIRIRTSERGEEAI